jgi:hypothetical protein
VSFQRLSMHTDTEGSRLTYSSRPFATLDLVHQSPSVRRISTAEQSRDLPDHLARGTPYHESTLLFPAPMRNGNHVARSRIRRGPSEHLVDARRGSGRFERLGIRLQIICRHCPLIARTTRIRAGAF